MDFISNSYTIPRYNVRFIVTNTIVTTFRGAATWHRQSNYNRVMTVQTLKILTVLTCLWQQNSIACPYYNLHAQWNVCVPVPRHYSPEHFNTYDSGRERLEAYSIVLNYTFFVFIESCHFCFPDRNVSIKILASLHRNRNCHPSKGNTNFNSAWVTKRFVNSERGRSRPSVVRRKGKKTNNYFLPLYRRRDGCDRAGILFQLSSATERQ